MRDAGIGRENRVVHTAEASCVVSLRFGSVCGDGGGGVDTRCE